MNIHENVIVKDLKSRFNMLVSDFGYHETDLYVVYSPEVFQHLHATYAFPQNLEIFYSRNWGHRMIEIPFALLDDKINRIIAAHK